MKHISLKNGLSLPMLGIGTDGFNDIKEGTESIGMALDIGYQLIDTATGYGSHPAVAQAIKQHDRDKLVICSKFHGGDISGSTTQNVVTKTLKELGLNYIDLLLIHNPMVGNYREVIKELINIKKDGIIKSIGVSNFTVKHLNNIDKEDLAHIDINQIEFHPYLVQEKLHEFCNINNILIMGYRPFCNGLLFNDSTLNIIASKYKKSIPQIVLKWLTTLKIIAIPKASQANHLKENIEIFDFELTNEEMSTISSLDKNLRTCNGPWGDFDDTRE